jgi:hypothetical protein
VAKLTAEQKAKEEEEQRKLADLRAKAEKEAKALAEARARAEAEAAALAKARAEAEAAVKKQAVEASQAEAQLKQRLKEEIEQRIRGEMEDLLKNEVEEKTRDEMRAQILEEAKLAAKAELEERIQAERDAIHKIEMEARSKAETEANARAAQESKLRAEAEARAVAATAAALKAEEDAKRARAQAEAIKAQAEADAKNARAQAEAMKAQAEADARRIREQAEAEAKKLRESEARARAEADSAGAKIEAERRAKYEAEARAKLDQEEADKRHRELEETLEAERKAKAEAEARARIEAKARETVEADTRAAVQAELESDMEKRAEIEGKAKAKAYMQEKVRAEQEEEEKMRADQDRRAKEMAELLRSKAASSEAEADDKPKAKRRPSGPRKPILRTALVVLGLLLVGAVVLAHVVPMRALAAKVEVALSKWLHDDVSIGGATFRIFPTPHLKVENVNVGKLLDAKASTGKIYLDPLSIFGDKLSINQIEFEGVQISGEAARRIPTWGNPQGKDEIGAVSAITLRNVKLDVKPALDAFNADLHFDRKGAFTRAMLTSPTWTVNMKPGDTGIDVDLDLRNYRLPAAIPVAISSATLKGKWSGNQIVVPEFDGTALDGKVTGTLKVTWDRGVRLESELALAKVSAKDLVATFTKDIAVTGRLDGNFLVTAEGASPELLFAAPRTQGKFRIAEGSVSNIDLVAVMQSDAAGSRAGVTKFAELTGEFSGAEHRAAYRNVSLQGGVLRGNGSWEIGQTSALNGRAVLEIRSQVAQDRGSFNVTGTVSRPIIRRGG